MVKFESECWFSEEDYLACNLVIEKSYEDSSNAKDFLVAKRRFSLLRKRRDFAFPNSEEEESEEEGDERENNEQPKVSEEEKCEVAHNESC